MNLNIKVFLKAMGILSIVMGAAMIFPFIVAIYYGELLVATDFLYCIIPTVLIGSILTLKIVPEKTKLTVRDGVLIVSFSWILASFIGGTPFVISGAIPNIYDAFFESASGLTTTGASILSDIESLPRGILFWRSFTHWLGGMGILVFAVAVLPSLGVGANIIASAEAPGPTMDKITPKISDTAKNLYIIYGVMTVIEIVLLMFAGLDWFDASTHSFATMGTGGFSTYNDSIAHFGSYTVEIIIIVFMIMAGVNFNLYYYAISRPNGIRNMFKDDEFKFYLFIIVGATALITLNLLLTNIYENPDESLRFSLFQTVSIMTTTGFASADYDTWTTFAKMIIFILFFVGGSSSSTGGGVKVIRVLVLLRLIKRSIQLQIHPNAIIDIKVNRKKLSIDTVSSIANFIFLHAMLVAIGTFIISFSDFDFLTCFSSVLTCIGNIGPGFNLVGPSMNFSEYGDFYKMCLSFLMISGRLELYTFIMLFAPKFWGSER